jgi:hypothetical protein
LAERCLEAASDCTDRQAQDELRALAEEFARNAKELESGPRDAIGEFTSGRPLTSATIAPKGATSDPLRCSSGAMLILRIIPRAGRLSELRTYQCADCGELQTFEIDPAQGA